MTTQYIEDVFGEGGLLAQRFPGYSPRPGQVALAEAVHAAFDGGRNLFAEAPTGVGKSIGYGVPATWHAASRGRRVAIVTANIALQEQLHTKDLPLLAQVLPWRFTHALAKGVNNYLCLDRLADQQAEMVMEGSAGSPEERAQWNRILDWSVVTQKGDLSELPFEPAAQLRRRFTVSSEECTGSKCSYADECHARRARKEFQQAQVVVTNYHLFFAHLAVYHATGGEAAILPPVDLVVFDEGHKAADIARDFFGFRITAGAVRWAVRLLAQRQGRSKKPVIPTIDAELHEDVLYEAQRFFDGLLRHRRGEDYKARLRERDVVPSERLVELLMRATELFTKASGAPLSLDAEQREQLTKAATRTAEIAGGIGAAMRLEDPDHVYFLSEENDRVALCSSLVDVSPVLRSALFESEKFQAVAVTSATLATAGSFDFSADSLGADERDEMVAESPFDWPKQCLLILPVGYPEPTDGRFSQAQARGLVEVVRMARGRTLGLFTSYRQLKAAARELEFARLGYPILVHGTAPRTKLVQQFKREVDSVLLGTDSFWAGIDVPGESLSCVAIDKLPFVGPDDPVLDAVAQRDPRGWFSGYSMPRAVIAFRQGFGRLIRAAGDRGVVVCFDRRIVDKGYGKTFLRSLPPVHVSYDLEDVGRFLDGQQAGVPIEEIGRSRQRVASGGRRAR